MAIALKNIIKAASPTDGAAIRAFIALDGSPPESADDQLEATAPAVAQPRSAVVELMERLANREAEISGHATALEAAFARGEAVGRAAAEEAIEDRREAALAALDRGIKGAREGLEGQFRALETLALLVAVEAVDKLTGNAERFRAMLTDAIVAQIHDVQDATIVSVSISRSDFPDTSEVAVLADRLGFSSNRLVVQDDLASGACTIILTLGTRELALAQSWEELRSLLAGLGGKAA